MPFEPRREDLAKGEESTGKAQGSRDLLQPLNLPNKKSMNYKLPYPRDWIACVALVAQGLRSLVGPWPGW